MTAERGSVQSLAQRITSEDIDDALIRREHLGASFNFEELGDSFRRINSIAEELRDLPTENLAPSSYAADLKQVLDRILREYIAIAGYDPSSDTTQAERAARIANVRSLETELLNLYVPAVGFLRGPSSVSADAVRASLAEAVVQLRSQLDSDRDETREIVRSILGLREAATEAANEVTVAAAAAQQAAGITAIASHAEVFEEQSALHRRSADRWLAVGIVGILTLLVSTFAILLVPIGDDIDDPRVIQLILLKALFVSFGTYFVVQAFRLYRTEHHLGVVNRHRHNALRTFEAFALGAKDSSTRDAVLMEATRAVFSPAQTGLIGAESSTPPQAALMEVFRRTQGSGSGQG